MTHCQFDDITHNQITTWNRHPLTVSPHDGILRDEGQDGRHDLLGRPVLETAECRLHDDDQEHDDSQGKVVWCRRVTEGFPRDEKDDDSDPEDGTEITECISQQFFPKLGFTLGQDVFAVSFQPTVGGGRVQSRGRGNIETVTDLFGSDEVVIEFVEELCIALVLFVGFYFESLRIVDLERESSELDGDPSMSSGTLLQGR